MVIAEKPSDPFESHARRDLCIDHALKEGAKASVQCGLLASAVVGLANWRIQGFSKRMPLSGKSAIIVTAFFGSFVFTALTSLNEKARELDFASADEEE